MLHAAKITDKLLHPCVKITLYLISLDFLCFFVFVRTVQLGAADTWGDIWTGGLGLNEPRNDCLVQQTWSSGKDIVSIVRRFAIFTRCSLEARVLLSIRKIHPSLLYNCCHQCRVGELEFTASMNFFTWANLLRSTVVLRW